jgi:hypothetical protein
MFYRLASPVALNPVRGSMSDILLYRIPKARSPDLCHPNVSPLPGERTCSGAGSINISLLWSETWDEFVSVTLKSAR